MTADDRPALPRPESQLEEAFIAEFLRARGHDEVSMKALPAEERKHLLEEASVYAGGRLTEIEARAHFVHELHGDTG